RLGVGIEEKFVRVKTQALLWLVGAVSPIPVELSRTQPWDKAVPYTRSSFFQPDSLALLLVLPRIEETQIDGLGRFGEEGKIDPSIHHCGSLGKGYPRHYRFVDAPGLPAVFDHVICFHSVVHLAANVPRRNRAFSPTSG